MNRLLLTLCQIAKKYNPLGTTARQTRQKYILNLTRRFWFNDSVMRLATRIFFVCNLIDILKLCPHGEIGSKKV